MFCFVLVVCGFVFVAGRLLLVDTCSLIVVVGCLFVFVCVCCCCSLFNVCCV